MHMFLGVLSRLLSGDELDGCEVVGLSGTSGGAMCAQSRLQVLVMRNCTRSEIVAGQLIAV